MLSGHVRQHYMAEHLVINQIWQLKINLLASTARSNLDGIFVGVMPHCVEPKVLIMSTLA